MKKSRKVMVNQLQVGNFVRLPVSWKDHPFLFSSFKLKQQAQIELIRKLGIEHVFVDIDKSETDPLTPEVASSKPQPKVDTDLASLTEEMQKSKIEKNRSAKKDASRSTKTQQEFDRSIAKMRNLINKLRSRPLNAIEDGKELIHDISNQLLNADNLVLHLMDEAKMTMGFTIIHSMYPFCR